MSTLFTDPFGFELYDGPVYEIDLTKEWYCPHCLIKLSLSNNVLFCPTHYEECEYSHENKKEREKSQTVWGKGYKYPLSRNEVKEIEYKNLIDEKKFIKLQMKRFRKRIKEIDEELILRNNQMGKQ
ncbi:hypothetical protein [Aliivibrio fischeri]|uniref:hypothetical protein n=1 Tax=Aliivibrio fischeri TaxID=668 RepID=UPI00080DB771|nr:hypothetical protein [Aliivibrio fischeri]OCH08118.1 hypothetical protein A6E09_17365 [Aliivibrio fischeri]